MLKDLKLEIVYKPIGSIVGYVNNTKIHPQSQIDQIKASIKEFGMVNPIGIHNGTIVFGHGRWEALKQLGYKEVPTVDLSHLSEAQRKAYTIADNRIAEAGEWDEDLLKLELITLDELGFDYSNLGFDFEFKDNDWETDITIPEKNSNEEQSEKFEIIIKCEDEDKKQLIEDKLSILISTEGIVGVTVS